MRARILRAILIAVAVTAVVLGVPLGIASLRLVESLNREALAARAQQIATTLDDELVNGESLNLDQVRLLVPPNGRLTVSVPGQPTRSLGGPLGSDQIVEGAPLIQQGRVTLAEDAGPTRTRQTQVAVLVILVILLTVAVGAAVAVITARRLANPLRHVAERASRLGAGDFRLDARRYQLMELDMVAEALDTSATALAQLVQRERELVGDVSHQLRSRLTALQLRLETMTAVDDEEVAQDAQAALEQAERLAATLDELLAAAREARAVGAEPVDLASTLPSMVDEWRSLLRAKGRSLRLRVPEGLIARATPAKLREAVGVLLDNAVMHGAGPVTISARRGDGTVVVDVSDGGVGVPDELAAHVFERGVSGGGSTGFGLALARALVESDGGRLELSTRQPATFTLFLSVPRAGDVRGVKWPAERGPR
ncbi:ATP-binding protein [Labedaea rhizosphaerae]|uniref:Signal transduction histidine-protein kinase/phosphatase MprB n=1 Tax=Labedaea rhizosphaerae TaxID=598644 RepID=A0A4R6S3L0_LABRH|nr:ATP-binding protein [Labedaea rhizosphaerae]TDP93667.1 signal transduction histidine kinase [Labedaea rhizosphaerae]